MTVPTIVLTTYAEAREALRHRDLRQALYDEGARLMEGVIVNLHGEDHVARRRLENRLFTPETFAWWETGPIPRIIDTVLAPALADGRGDLLALARRTMMLLSLDVAGVDLPPDPHDAAAAVERLAGLMEQLARASTVAHATGDKQALIDSGDAALTAFDTEFHQPALARRRALVETGAETPRDVLSTLLVNADRLDLPSATVLREVAYYPWVGSHSTSAQLVHAMHHLFTWLTEHPHDREALTANSELRQRFVHESMRLHPASPVAVRRALADVTLRTGRRIPAGAVVTIDMDGANRDPEAVGPEPDRFDPWRSRAEGVAPWGLSFGHGTHACLGRDLAAGTETGNTADTGDGIGDRGAPRLHGVVAIMAGVLLDRGASPDPNDPPTLDPHTTRVVWGRYPVRFG